MTWLSGYSTRRAIPITGSSVGVQTDYQKELVLHAAARPITDTGSYALDFVAANVDRVAVADSNSLDIIGDITIEATICPKTVAGYCTILTKRYLWTAGSTACNYQLEIHDGKVLFGYFSGTYGAGGAWHLWETTSAWIKNFNWYRIVVKFTFGTAASIACFINGQRYAGSWTTGTGASAVLASGYGVTFGAYPKQASPYYADIYNGTMQEIRISNCLRTDAEIWANARDDIELTVDANTMGLWHFSENTGTNLDDETTNANDGTITGADWVNGYWANHVFLNGHVISGTFADIRFTNAADVALDYWVDPDSILYGNKCKCVVEVNSIAASPTVTSIYIYYGKTGDTSVSSGDNAFDFYADFDASDIDDDGTQEGFTPGDGTWAVGWDSLYTNELSADPAHTKDPSMIKKPSTGEYYLFTTSGLSGQGIAIAKSYDKKHFVYLKRLWLEGRWNQWGPCLLEEDGICYMTACTSVDSDFEHHSEIHWWTSDMTDLENWVYHGKLFGPATWGTMPGVMTSQIRHFGSTYYMYFDIVQYDVVGHNHSIGYATSTTAPASWTSSSFTDQGLLFYSSEAWEDQYVFCPSVTLVDSTYVMHYTGGGPTQPFHIGYATASAPGGAYTKQGQITLNATPDWCGSQQSNPCVLYQDGQYELWFHGTETQTLDHNANSVSYMVCTDWPTDWDVQGRKAYRQTDAGLGVAKSSTGLTIRDVRIDVRCKGTGSLTDVGPLWHYYTSNDYCYKARLRSDTNVHNFEKYAGSWSVISADSLAPYTNPAAWVFRSQTILHYYNVVQAMYANGALVKIGIDTSIPNTGLVQLNTINEAGIFQFLRVSKYVYPEPVVQGISGQEVDLLLADGLKSGDTPGPSIVREFAITDGFKPGDGIGSQLNMQTAATDGVKLAESALPSVVKELLATDGFKPGDGLASQLNIQSAATDGFKLGDSLLPAILKQLLASDGLRLGDLALSDLIKLLTVTDGFKLGDSLAPSLSFTVSLTDGLKLSETLAGKYIFNPAIVDGLKGGDSITAAIYKQLQASEVLRVGDIPTGQIVVNVSLAEGVRFSDAVSPSVAFTKALVDGLILADLTSPVSGATYSLTLIDGFKAGDSVSALKIVNISVTDGARLGETIRSILNFAVALTDGFKLGDLTVGAAGAPIGFTITVRGHSKAETGATPSRSITTRLHDQSI